MFVSSGLGRLSPDEEEASDLAFEAQLADRFRNTGPGRVFVVMEDNNTVRLERRLPAPEARHRLLTLMSAVDEEKIRRQTWRRSPLAWLVPQLDARSNVGGNEVEVVLAARLWVWLVGDDATPLVHDREGKR